MELHEEKQWSRSLFLQQQNNDNDMDYWKLQTFYQAGKMELLENKYIITHRKYQEACLEIAGQAHFEHQILHSYTQIDIQKEWDQSYRGKCNYYLRKQLSEFFFSMRPFRMIIFTNQALTRPSTSRRRCEHTLEARWPRLTQRCIKHMALHRR